VKIIILILIVYGLALSVARAMTRRRWLIVSAASGIFLAGAVTFLNLRLTYYIESDRFRASLENETAKGLDFPSGHYAPIRRAGFGTVGKRALSSQRR
jgi:uncharacterized membrane protein YdfJ with MMPL/SSD domain